MLDEVSAMEELERCRMYGKYINPGTDTTINPVIINDTHRERQHSSEQPKEYIINDTLIGAIGEWHKGPHDINKILSMLRSRPHPAPAQGTSKLCFGTITLVAEECRKCNEIETCKQKQSILDYQKQEIATAAARKAREDVLDLIDGRIEGLRILFNAPKDEKTMTDAELLYAIEEIKIIRNCIEIDQSTQQQAGEP